MRQARWWILCVAVLWWGPAGANTALRVVTTLPDVADWTRQLGADRVAVQSLLHGAEDPHTYEPTVGDVKALAGARVLLRVGFGLEEWLDGLVENARNSELMIIDTARNLTPIADAEEGGHGEAHGDEGEHHHGEGNPHVWLDPWNAMKMCSVVAQALEAADPVGGSFYQQRFEAYSVRLQQVARQLRDEVSALSDRRFVAYHPAWPYFARAFGFEVAAVITPIPGQEPSARSLATLIKRIRKEKIRVVVTEPQLPSEIPDLLVEETGIRVVTLSPLLGSGTATDYVTQMEDNVRRLLAALQGASR